MFRATPVLQFRATQASFAAPTTLPGFRLRAAVVNAVKDKFTLSEQEPRSRADGTMSTARLKYITDFARLYNEGKITIPLSKNTMDRIDHAFRDINAFQRDSGAASDSARKEVAKWQATLLERIKEDLPDYEMPSFANNIPFDEEANDAVAHAADKEDWANFIERRIKEEAQAPASDIVEFEMRNHRAKWDTIIEPAHKKSFRNTYEEYLRQGYTIQEINRMEDKQIPEPITNKFPDVFVPVAKDLHVQKIREIRQQNSFDQYGLPKLTAPEPQLEAQFAPKEVDLEATVNKDLERERQEAETAEGKAKIEAAKKLLFTKLSSEDKQLFERIFPVGSRDESQLSPSDLKAFRRFKQKLVNCQYDLYPPKPTTWTPFEVNYDVEKLLAGKWELTRLSKDPAFAAHKDRFLTLARQAQQEYKEFEEAGGKVTLQMLVNPEQRQLALTNVMTQK